MIDALIPIVCAFVVGAVYEYEAAKWAIACGRGQPFQAAGASFACGMCLVVGVGLSVGSFPVGFAYAIGYAVGTWLAVR